MGVLMLHPRFAAMLKELLTQVSRMSKEDQYFWLWLMGEMGRYEVDVPASTEVASTVSMIRDLSLPDDERYQVMLQLKRAWLGSGAYA